jgi:hypothetical protein
MAGSRPPNLSSKPRAALQVCRILLGRLDLRRSGGTAYPATFTLAEFSVPLFDPLPVCDCLRRRGSDRSTGGLRRQGPAPGLQRRDYNPRTLPREHCRENTAQNADAENTDKNSQ